MIRSAVTVSLVPEARGGPFVLWDDLPAACQTASELGLGHTFRPEGRPLFNYRSPHLLSSDKTRHLVPVKLPPVSGANPSGAVTGPAVEEARTWDIALAFKEEIVPILENSPPRPCKLSTRLRCQPNGAVTGPAV